MAAGARRRPHERGSAARGPPRASGAQAPHGTVAQRSGVDGSSALAETDAVRDRRAGGRAGARSCWSSTGPRFCGHARAYPHPACAAGSLCPPPAGPRRDARARPRSLERRRPPRQRFATRLRRTRGERLSARPCCQRHRARLRRRHPQLDRCLGRSRLRRRVPRRLRDRHGPPLAPGRGDRVVVKPEIRFRARGRRLLNGIVDAAQQAQPRPGRARPRPHRNGDRAAHRSADAAQGIAARLPARSAGIERCPARCRAHATARRSKSWPD